MVGTVVRKLRKKGYDTRIISIGRLEALGSEIEDLNVKGLFDVDFYKVLKGFYNFELEKHPFPIRSIIVAAFPCPQVRVHFTRRGVRVPITIPPTYIDYVKEPVYMQRCLAEILDGAGFHAVRVHTLPEKLLAVRSGLSTYGRNNLCYVSGMGSFALISAYYSDLPCTEDSWGGIRVMEACGRCSACLNKCPTGAITKERYLVRAERCITYYNEFTGAAEFPAWMDPAAHNCIIGCLLCQLCCPQNREYIKNVVELEEFDERETGLLLEGAPPESLPGALASKLRRLNLMTYYDHLAYNLKVLLDR